MSTTPATNISATERQTPPAASAACVASNQNNDLNNTSLKPRNLETKFATGGDNKRHDHPTRTPSKDDKRVEQKVTHDEDYVDESHGAVDLDIDLDTEHLIGQDEVADLDRFTEGKVTKDRKHPITTAHNGIA